MKEIVIDDGAIEFIYSNLNNEETGRWAFGILRRLMSQSEARLNPILALLHKHAPYASSLLTFVTSSDTEARRAALRALTAVTDTNNQLYHLFEELKVSDWAGYEAELVAILRKKVAKQAKSILQAWNVPVDDVKFEIELDDINWWLAWLQEIREDDWFSSYMGRFLARATGPRTQEALLIEFNDNKSEHRPVLAKRILAQGPVLELDKFTGETIKFLIADMASTQNSPYNRLLGRIVSEDMVENLLMPLTTMHNDILQGNLKLVLKRAGDRHGRRYVDTNFVHEPFWD